MIEQTVLFYPSTRLLSKIERNDHLYAGVTFNGTESKLDILAEKSFVKKPQYHYVGCVFRIDTDPDARILPALYAEDRSLGVSIELGMYKAVLFLESEDSVCFKEYAKMLESIQEVYITKVLKKYSLTRETLGQTNAKLRELLKISEEEALLIMYFAGTNYLT